MSFNHIFINLYLERKRVIENESEIDQGECAGVSRTVSVASTVAFDELERLQRERNISGNIFKPNSFNIK